MSTNIKIYSKNNFIMENNCLPTIVNTIDLHNDF